MRRTGGVVPLRSLGGRISLVSMGSRFPFGGTLGRSKVSVVTRIGGTSPSGKLVTRSFSCINVTGSCRRTNTSTVSILARPFFFVKSSSCLDRVSRGISVPLLEGSFIISRCVV